MARWTFPIHLEPEGAGPVYLQIARAVREDIRRGRLRPGDALPGSRTLAAGLGVHRNTVLAALRDLQAEGWLQTAERTLRVAEDLPQGRTKGPALGGRPGFPFEPAPPLPWSLPTPRPGTLSFGGGLPDLRLVPVDLLGRAFRRALRSPALLGYGDPRGEARLRSALAGLLSEARGLAVDPEGLVVTNGSQMALDLVARALLRPGDRVAVEDPGYAPAWTTLRAAGAELVPVPVDGGGLQVEALAALLERGPLRALYCTPHHQVPTTVTMNAARRMALLALARRHRMAVLEDDYDFEFHYDGSPALPLAALDASGSVVYIGSLSKVLAPGLRVGFLAGPRAVVDAAARLRYASDRQGNHALERAVAELLEDGLLQRHVRKVRRLYLARRAVLAEHLDRRLGGVVTYQLPPGGMSLWLRVDPAVDAEAWVERCEARGVHVLSGRAYDFHGRPLPNLRLGYTTLDEKELREGVRRMAEALEPGRVGRSGPSPSPGGSSRSR